MNATVYAFSWDYDPAGNRLVQLANFGTASGSATYYTYNAANELTTLHVVGGSFGGIQPGHTYFEYDATGNLTVQSEPDGTTYFTYTPFNLVASIHHKDATWTRCWYDGQLRRSALEDATHGLRYFTWDQNGLNLLSEQSATGELTRRYTHGYTPISGIGSLTLATDPTTSAAASPFMDHRGTVLGVVSSLGLVTPYAYNAFGLALGDLADGPAVTHRWRYQTNWLQLADCLALSPTRTYSCFTGTFLQRDPLFVAPSNIRRDVLENVLTMSIRLGIRKSSLLLPKISTINIYAGSFARNIGMMDSFGLYDQGSQILFGARDELAGNRSLCDCKEYFVFRISDNLKQISFYMAYNGLDLEDFKKIYAGEFNVDTEFGQLQQMDFTKGFHPLEAAYVRISGGSIGGSMDISSGEANVVHSDDYCANWYGKNVIFWHENVLEREEQEMYATTLGYKNVGEMQDAIRKDANARLVFNRLWIASWGGQESLQLQSENLIVSDILKLLDETCPKDACRLYVRPLKGITVERPTI